jgi:hypothetical protein
MPGSFVFRGENVAPFALSHFGLQFPGFGLVAARGGPFTATHSPGPLVAHP